MRKRRLIFTIVLTLIGLAAIWFSIGGAAMNKEDRTGRLAKQFAEQSQRIKDVPQMIGTAKSAGAAFERRELFQSAARLGDGDAQLRGVLNDGAVLNIDQSALQRVIRENVEFLELPLPNGKGGTVELELVKVNIFAPGFSVKTSVPTGENLEESYGVHYRGIVKGDDHSLAAISVFKHEVMGFFSTEAAGNSVVGRLEGNNPSDKHIVYAESDLKVHPDFHCDTEDPNVSLPETALQEPERVATTCVRQYIEANYDLYLNKESSVPNVVSYLTGMYNQVAALYANEGVSMATSEFFVWNTPSPYTGTNSQGMLTQFRTTRTSFNGDIAHLVSLQNYGGIAYLDVLCNQSFRYGFSGIFASYNAVPTYSWTVEVFTHETGHNLGSPHTHACAWNGNNTAIDACGPTAGYPYEGSCSNAPLPTNGGTIMSYCHLLQNIGINFANGFSVQPRNVILNRIAASTCLSSSCGSAGGHVRSDFDGDSRSDIGVYRSSNGGWYIQNSGGGTSGTSFGASGDLSAPADYDGDGKTDIAVFRPSTGTWYLLRSRDGFTAIGFGANGDLPASGDFDGDGKADIAVFRPSNGGWYIQRSTSGFLGLTFGTTGDVPVVGDYDNDGKADVAVFRQGNGGWYIQQSTAGFSGVTFGAIGDRAVPADYDGDGKTDVAVFRPANGTWYLQRSTQGFTAIAFGANGDKPAPGDYDGDGKYDLGVFRPSTGGWYIQRSTAGFYGQSFGTNGDVPTAGAYVQ